MKIKIENYSQVREYDSLEDYAESKLDGDDYGKGTMEAAADTARNNSQAIGRLLDLMADRGLVSAEEAATIVGEYTSGSAVFGS